MPERRLGDIDPVAVGNAMHLLRQDLGDLYLNTALAVWIKHSFSEAADMLQSNVKTVRSRIRKLEDAVGGPIFLRDRNRLLPTECGLSLLRHAARQRLELADAVRGMQCANKGKSGRLSIGFCGPLGAGRLRDFLFDPSLRQPQVQCEYKELPHTALLEKLASYCIDLAIIQSVTPPDFNGRTLPLWRERVAVALPPAHPLAASDSVSWSDLAGETFLVSAFRPAEAITRLIGQRCAHEDAARIVIQEQSLLSLMHRVEAGCGICLVPEFILLDELRDRIAFRDLTGPSGPDYVTTYAYWYPPDRNPALRRFVEDLRRRYSPTQPRSREA